MRSMDRKGADIIEFYENKPRDEEFFLDYVVKIDELRKNLEIDTYREQCIRWIEILGALAYISRTMLPGSDFITVNQRFIQEKPKYNKTAENRHAWDILNKANLLSPTIEN